MQITSDGGEAYFNLKGLTIFDSVGCLASKWDHLCDKRLAFRFAGDNINSDVNNHSLSATGIDHSCSVAFVSMEEGERSLADEQWMKYSENGSWGGSPGSEVKLGVVSKRTLLQWIQKRDWSRSWLNRHMGVPENAISLIHEFLTLFQPNLEFALEKDDLWISVEFSEYSTSLGGQDRCT